jgi:hypothetical protein
MPYAEVPAFMRRLAKRADGAAPALAFLILTAARTSEVRGMTWDEIDLDSRIWIVPKSRMKGGREHKVPLSEPAIEILRSQLAARRDGDRFCFPGKRLGNPVYDTSLTTLIERMGATTKVDGKDVVVIAHGFRSAFRDFAGDETDFSREVAEAALAHIVGDTAEQAYRRGDALEKRRAADGRLGGLLRRRVQGQRGRVPGEGMTGGKCWPISSPARSRRAKMVALKGRQAPMIRIAVTAEAYEAIAASRLRGAAHRGGLDYAEAPEFVSSFAWRRTMRCRPMLSSLRCSPPNERTRSARCDGPRLIWRKSSGPCRQSAPRPGLRRMSRIAFLSVIER